MKKFYYQIKRRTISEEKNIFGGNWDFPPVYSNIIEANDKKEAKKLIDEEYGRVFPLRVLQKDLEQHHYLLCIEEATDYHLRLFEHIDCEYCGNKFRIIDKYNDEHSTESKNRYYCSDKCKNESYEIRRNIVNENNNMNISAYAVIYKITNKVTGLSYIGKTTQVFTLRWYQHFYQHGDCKFHKAIKESKFSDWIFEIVEEVKIPDDNKYNLNDINKIVIEREKFYINKYNSVNEGYNTLN